jgi:hypothetical protein
MMMNAIDDGAWRMESILKKRSGGLGGGCELTVISGFNLNALAVEVLKRFQPVK